MKRIITFTMLLVLIISLATYADDNADTGSGDTHDALEGKGFYRSGEYMYKVSIYVGLSDQSDETKSLEGYWHRIDNDPVYIKPPSFTLASGVIGAKDSKVIYLKNGDLQAMSISDVMVSNPPPIPITNSGNIGAVKSYFGDTSTLNALIDWYAKTNGTSREALVAPIQFTINNKKSTYPPKEILPIKIDGTYQNKVPWLIIYEPVIITYLKDKTTILAFTATEYALAQKLGYFNFGAGSDGQYVSGMTHSDLPNSIVLEQPWFGFPVTPALPDGVKWSNDRIIQGGGWGMRIMRPGSVAVVDNDTTYDYDYRVDTDVITSVRITADEDITPDNRHDSEAAYANPTKNTATVTITANGYSKSTEIVLPKGGSQLVWLKWHTPKVVGQVNVTVQMSGNTGAKIDGNLRSTTLTCKVSDLSQNDPPDPTANDRNDGFTLVPMPIKADKLIAQWGIYSSSWQPDWIWHPKWVWKSKWTWVDVYGWIGEGEEAVYDIVGGYWTDNGKWVDKGHWVDEGWWIYTYTNYQASLRASMNLFPEEHVQTAIGETMKSGYGVQVDIDTSLVTNAPSSHLTYVQNAIATFPEFSYMTYWRLLDYLGAGNFAFKPNIYSTYNSPVHFTPLWYPDGPYPVYVEILDVWTPAGMLRMSLSDQVTIKGILYEDYHIGPVYGGD